jgi:hypothetical protein
MFIRSKDVVKYYFWEVASLGLEGRGELCKKKRTGRMSMRPVLVVM